MAKNNGKAKKNYCTQQGDTACTQGTQLFFFWVKVGLSICVVLNIFSSSSQCAPQHGPNRSSFYPILFVLNSILVTFITSPKEDIKTYLLSKALFYFIFVTSQLKMPITKEKN